jgi:ribonuclease P protein component
LTVLSFQPSQRLLSKAEFDQVYQHGIRAADPLLTLHAYHSSQRARLGMSVSTKNAGSSVRRNQLRRWIREDFRLRQTSLPPADWVVTVRALAKNATHPELSQVLERLYHGLSQRLVTATGAHS